MLESDARPAGRRPALVAALVVLGLLITALVIAVFGGRGLSVGAPATPAPTPIPEPSTQVGGGVVLEPVIEDLERPLGLAFTGGWEDVVFVAQQGGIVRYIEGGELGEEPALDISEVTLVSGEQGMLGIALHPEFADNGKLYVTYVHTERATVLAEYTAPDGIHADPDSARELLRLPQESNYHKGGALVFGEDGLLYMSVGDDAWPRGTTPDYTDDFRGSIIRIDVDAPGEGRPYGIPDGNAFSPGEGPPEVFDYGLRNPWRMSIDPETGDLWIADVGTNRYEEVDRHPGSVAAGLDYGWGAWEGFECRRNQIREELDCDDWADATPPVLALEGTAFESGDCAVIGGYVYRGDDVPALQGMYVFGDFCSGRLRTVPHDAERPEPAVVLDSFVAMGSFGMDAEGELYVTDVASGALYRIRSE